MPWCHQRDETFSQYPSQINRERERHIHECGRSVGSLFSLSLSHFMKSKYQGNLAFCRDQKKGCIYNQIDLMRLDFSHRWIQAKKWAFRYIRRIRRCMYHIHSMFGIVFRMNKNENENKSEWVLVCNCD